MNEKNHSNGFILGLAIGAAVGALVSTKKGREILKDVADYGLEYVGNIINLDDLEAVMNDEEGEEMMNGEVGDTKPQETTAQATEEEPTKPLRRRLFRGIRKK